jgi:hypothetical protein
MFEFQCSESPIMNDLPEGFISAALDYQFLEQKIRRLISWVCFPFCSECGGFCCKKDICHESLNSFWLKFMWKIYNHNSSRYHDSRGWLSSNGCLLPVGRPLVCYEYICDSILEKISEKSHLKCLKELSRLLTLAGQKALGNSHLVTLSSKQILTQLNFEKLRGRISKALYLYYKHERDLCFSNGHRLNWNNANHI